MKMTKTLIATSCVVLAATLSPVTVNAADTGDAGQRAKTFVKDSAITTKVKAKLAAEKPSSLATVNVDTDANGVVTLSGSLKTKEEADKAVSIAHATEGVKSVTNNIKVSP